MRIKFVEISDGYNFKWITFKDQVDLDYELRGHVYTSPTISSWKRLLRVMNEYLKIELYPDCFGVIIAGFRQ